MAGEGNQNEGGTEKEPPTSCAWIARLSPFPPHPPASDPPEFRALVFPLSLPFDRQQRRLALPRLVGVWGHAPPGFEKREWLRCVFLHVLSKNVILQKQLLRSQNFLLLD